MSPDSASYSMQTGRPLSEFQLDEALSLLQKKYDTLLPSAWLRLLRRLPHFCSPDFIVRLSRGCGPQENNISLKNSHNDHVQPLRIEVVLWQSGAASVVVSHYVFLWSSVVLIPRFGN